jgi:hypothetical protein
MAAVIEIPDDICTHKMKAELLKSSESTIQDGGTAKFQGLVFNDYNLLVKYIEAYCSYLELKKAAVLAKISGQEYLERFKKIVAL